MKKQDKVLFLYGRLRYKRKAVLYCDLHKCFVDKQQLFSKKFKCENCKHRRDVDEGS